MRSVVTFAVFALAAGVIVPKYAAQMHPGAAAPTVMAARPQPAAASNASDSRSVVISPQSNGHFEVEGRVDGRAMNFMVDTGASVIALTSRDAAMLGVHPAQSDYTAMVRTANGTVRAAPVTLDMVEIDDIAVHNVAAMVMPDGALADNLLGLTFLSRLHRFEYSDGKLVLEQ
ncbi:MAG: TIGR02281 family clan AA aspartic protease [Xanthobacteraceae bacterium]